MLEPVVEEQTGHQEKTGRAFDQGISTADFNRFCLDIIEQPRWRPMADRCADYYDGNQLDAETLAALKAKGMDVLIANLVKPTVNVVLGMEAKTRTDWRVMADDDAGEEVAQALSAKLHEVERETRADRACSDAYAGQVKAGVHWVEVSRNADPFKYPYRVEPRHRREIWWDWRAKQPDTLDGRYLLRKQWYDVDEACALMQGQEKLIMAAGTGWGPWWVELEHLDESTGLAQSFFQEARTTMEELEWRDVARRRICFYETWYRRIRRGYVLKLPDGRAVELDMKNAAHQMAVARGYLKPQQAVYSKWGMSVFMGPHKMADYGVNGGGKRHPYVPFWGFREDLTNIPYGLIRDMLSPQDEVNSRRQHMHWLLTAKRMEIDSDALDQKFNSISDVADEVNNPDAVIVRNPSRKRDDAIRITQDFELSKQQYMVMTNAEELIQKTAGVFNAMLGRESSTNSGIAINSLVEQGNTGMAEINDNSRYARTQVGEMLKDMLIEDMMGKPVDVHVEGNGAKRKIISLNTPAKDPATGVPYLKNDLRRAKTKVALADVQSAPSYRAQLFMMMGEVIKSMPPQAQAVLAPFWMEESDHPKRKQMADQLRKLFGITDEDDQDPEKQRMMVMIQQLQAALQEAINGPLAQESAAKVRKLLADAALAMAKTEQTKADTEIRGGEAELNMARGTVDLARQIDTPPAQPKQQQVGT